MHQLVARLALAGLLATSLIGCGFHSHNSRHGQVRTGRGDGVGLLALGIVAGVAIASAGSEPPPKQEVIYVNHVHVNVPPSPPPPPPSREVAVTAPELPAYDPIAARLVLEDVNLASCSAAGAKPVWGHAKIVMNPDGHVSKVVVDEPAGLSPETVQCVGDRLGTATVKPFRGNLVTIGTTFYLPSS